MARYVWLENQWVPETVAKAKARHEPSGPAVVSDFDAPLLCHADGRYHSTRRTYDAAVKAAGCEIIGKTEARRMAATQRPAPALEPVGATLKRLLNGG
jgi:hypothetical protein